MQILDTLLSQFASLPYPTEDCSGKTIIITGANSGLGLEVAKHFVLLNASHVIMACRNVEKGEEARINALEPLQQRTRLSVWQLDLASFDSVRDFAARVVGLDRVDVFLNNAGIYTMATEQAEGHDLQVTINVISTLLLSIQVLPVLRKTGAKFNVIPHLVIVTSDAAFYGNLSEKSTDRVLDVIDSNTSGPERYNATKLLQLVMMARLAAATSQSGKGQVLINALNPGLCANQLFREQNFPMNIIMNLFMAVFARTPEVGSRTLMAAAFAGEETHGNWMTDCRLHKWPAILQGEEGASLMQRVWEQLLEVVEQIEPGVTSYI